MSALAEQYDRVAAAFTEQVRSTAGPDWERPAPCEGWVARDVVRHLVEWVPGFFEVGLGENFEDGPSVDDDPAGAWRHLDGQLRALVDDPSATDRRLSHPQAGDHALLDAVSMFVTSDLLVHTWDLATACGRTVRLDPEVVHDVLTGFEMVADTLHESDHYGRPVPVRDDADEQTRLIAITGRRP